MYLWVKAFHIIAVIAWMAATLYLPRLYVYHADAPPGSDKAATFEMMERRLLRGILGPGMVLTVLFGGLLVAQAPQLMHERWLQAKLVLVVLMMVYAHFLMRWRRRFASGAYPHSARFFRAVNEIPTLLLIGIVILAVVKP